VPQQQVFISYSHKDAKWFKDLEIHLTPYLRAGSIKSWSDKEIAPGSEWLSEIKTALAQTKVAVLLVTPDFIASDFIHEHELGPFLKEAKQDGIRILWVPVRASAYKKTALKDYQAFLNPDQPLANMPDAKRDQAWVKICEEIEKAVNEPREGLLRSPSTAPHAMSQAVSDNAHGESKRRLITSIEFTLERPFIDFDEEKFKIALKLATGIDASLIRIASIRSGSTIVKIDGEQEALAAIIHKIQFSQEVARQLAVETGMRKMVWEIDGTRYELKVDRPCDNDNLLVPKPAIVRTEPLKSSVGRQDTEGEERAAETDNTTIKEVVLLVHGIRDFAEWEQKVSPILERIPYTRVPPLSYGRFDAFRFWFPFWTREAPVKKLLWRIRSARDRFSTAKLSVIAHSFGTYAIGKILRENPDIRLHRLILCGAILPSEFRWDQIRHSVETEIINDCGIRDIWPVLAQSTTFGYGPSGRFGFGTPGVRDRYHDFGHGGFFEDSFVANYWLPWFRSGNFVKSNAPPRSGTRWHLLTIIQLKWIAILLCGVGVLWFGIRWFETAWFATGHASPTPLGLPAMRNQTIESAPSHSPMPFATPIRGKMIIFGISPITGDKDIPPNEDLTLVSRGELKTNPEVRKLFAADQPPGTTGLMARLDPNKHYLSCQFSQSRDKHFLVSVKNPNSEHPPVEAMVVEWGPPKGENFPEYKDAVAALSPGLADTLGLKKGDQVEISFVPN
jgi:hypothetical protein